MPLVTAYDEVFLRVLLCPQREYHMTDAYSTTDVKYSSVIIIIGSSVKGY